MLKSLNEWSSQIRRKMAHDENSYMDRSNFGSGKEYFENLTSDDNLFSDHCLANN